MSPENGLTIGAEKKRGVSKVRLGMRLLSAAVAIGGSASTGFVFYDTVENNRPEARAIHRQIDPKFPPPSTEDLFLANQQVFKFKSEVGSAIDSQDYVKMPQIISANIESEKKAQSVLDADKANKAEFDRVAESTGLNDRRSRDVVLGFSGIYTAMFATFVFAQSFIMPERTRKPNRRDFPSKKSQVTT